jgi:hypothetical protein
MTTGGCVERNKYSFPNHGRICANLNVNRRNMSIVQPINYSHEADVLGYHATGPLLWAQTSRADIDLGNRR